MIKFSETFYSIQGEGYFTGVPSAWLRFYLCNLQCNGFGQKDPTNPDTYDLPYERIDATNIDHVTDLPVFEKGCDSSYSWAKKFRHLQTEKTAAEIRQVLKDEMRNEFNPDGHFIHPVSGEQAHLVFTGGEPLMRHAQKACVEIMEQYRGHNDRPSWITWETNGTQKLTEQFRDFFGNRGACPSQIFFSCSPKLWTVAGEEAKRAIKPEIVKEYDMVARLNRREDTKYIPNGQLKFVLGTAQEQWDELDNVVKQFRDAGVDWPVWIMPCGATVEGQKECDGDVATMAQARGYSVSARVHTYLWGNVIGV